MNFYIELITILAEVLLFWFFFSKHFYASKPSPKHIILFLLFYTTILCVGTFYFSLIIRLTILFLYILLGNYLLFKIKSLKIIYLSILFFTSSAVSDLICGTLVASLWNLKLQNLTTNTLIYLIYYSVAKLIHLIILLIINRFFSIKNSNRSILNCFPLILCHSVSILIFHLIYKFHYLNGNPLLICLSTIALLYINIVLCFYVEFLFHHQEERERRLVAEQQLIMNERFYSDMLQRQEETRSLWHDIKKYILAVECLIAENNTSEAKSQFQKILGSYNQICYTVDSGNAVIDGILNHEMLFAKQHNVTVNLDLWISPYFSVDATDMYIILGNTIDNAIEACTDLPEEMDKIIHISLRQKEHILLYEIRNPYQKSSPKKLKKKFHGYGLQNVKKCVNNNHGTFEFKKSDNIVTVTIQLNV